MSHSQCHTHSDTLSVTLVVAVTGTLTCHALSARYRVTLTGTASDLVTGEELSLDDENNWDFIFGQVFLPGQTGLYELFSRLPSLVSQRSTPIQKTAVQSIQLQENMGGSSKNCQNSSLYILATLAGATQRNQLTALRSRKLK